MIHDRDRSEFAPLGRPAPSAWLRLLQIGTAAVLAIAAVQALSKVYLEERTERVPEIATFGKLGQTPLFARATVDGRPTTQLRTTTLWLTVANQTAEVFLLDRVELSSPGFSIPDAPRAPDGWQEVGGGPWSLAPSDSVALAVPLAAERLGRNGVLVRFRGEGSTEEGATLRQRGSLELTRLSVVSTPGLLVAEFGAALSELLVQLTLPAGLALLGWLLQSRQQLMVQERQAWRQMLPDSHKNNVEIYLPMMGAISDFRTSLTDGPPPSQTGAAAATAQVGEVVLYRFLQVLRRAREAGTLYFMDREGENLTADCWELFMDRLQARLAPVAQVSTLLDGFDLDESLAGFKEKRVDDYGAAADALAIRLATWLNRSPADFQLLFLYRNLLYFEVNRIYRFWYQEDPSFPAGDWSAAKDKLLDPASYAEDGDFRAQLAEFAAKLDRYADDVRARLGRQARSDRAESWLRWW